MKGYAEMKSEGEGECMIKTIIFDFDGLLADTEIVSWKIYNELLEEFGHTFTIEEYARNYSGKTETENVSSLIETYCLPWSVKEGLEKVSNVEKKLLAEGVDLKHGVRELLEYLKKNRYETAIASSSTRDRAFGILKRHNITGYFDEFVFAGEVTKGKPNPEIFLKVCEKTGKKPGECLVLEDSEAGIQAAHSAKIPVICIPDMKKPDKKYLDLSFAVVRSLEEVIDYL